MFTLHIHLREKFVEITGKKINKALCEKSFVIIKVHSLFCMSDILY